LTTTYRQQGCAALKGTSGGYGKGRGQAAQLSYAHGEGQISERLANIKSIMNNLHLSAEKAMEALGIPAVDFPKYRGQL